MTKSKGMENSYGLMEDHTKEIGFKVSNMERESMSLLMELRSVGNGKKERESDG